MPAYVVVMQHDVTDGPDMARYRDENEKLMERHGGTFVVRGGAPETREGDAVERVVVLAFPDRDAAQAWYEDPDYQAIAPLRHANATTRMAIVDGYDA
jgi:uncharacterized protein (DUF1330 family)